jgi:hypothetical protein
VPWLGAIDFRAFARSTEDVIQDNVKGHNLLALVKEAGYHKFESLKALDKRYRRTWEEISLTKTIIPATNPLRRRMTQSIKASLLLKVAKKSSSNKKGADSARENGHPRIPPNANQNIPWAVLRPPRQFMKEAIPSIVVYIAKLEGRNAADAWNMPGLNTIAIRKNKAILGFNVPFITRKSCVSQMAQVKARAYRMK